MNHGNPASVLVVIVDISDVAANVLSDQTPHAAIVTVCRRNPNPNPRKIVRLFAMSDIVLLSNSENARWRNPYNTTTWSQPMWLTMSRKQSTACTSANVMLMAERRAKPSAETNANTHQKMVIALKLHDTLKKHLHLILKRIDANGAANQTKRWLEWFARISRLDDLMSGQGVPFHGNLEYYNNLWSSHDASYTFCKINIICIFLFTRVGSWVWVHCTVSRITAISTLPTWLRI